MGEVVGIASLVVGVLPLLVATAEHYDDFLRPWYRYRNYDSEVKKYYQDLKNQKAIFRNDCCLLLSTALGDDKATAVLGQSLAMQDPKLDERLAHHLGESGEACLETLKAIEEQLEKIGGDCSSLWDAVDQGQNVGLTSFSVTNTNADLVLFNRKHRSVTKPGAKEWAKSSS